MSDNNKITSIPFRNEQSEKIEIILRNLIKMLSKRIYFEDENDINDKGVSILSRKTKNGIVTLSLDEAYESLQDKGDNVYLINTLNGQHAIKILFESISSIAKGSIIRGFLDDYENLMKIVVVSSINSKASQISKKDLQIFEIESLMEDITEHKFQPQFIVLNQAQKKDVFEKYSMEPLTCLKFEQTDPIVKYYGLRTNDMLKIIRPSPLSCLEVAYRIVYR